MGRLVWDDDTEEIDLGDGDAVTVPVALSVKQLAEVTTGTGGGGIEILMAMLRHLIKSWRGPSFVRNGEPVPCTPENIDRLDAATAQLIGERLNAKFERRSADERKGSSATSSTS